MENQRVVIRFDEHCARDKYALRRVEGTATVDSMIRLIDVADLEANPREAKVGEVTDAIQETLDETPYLFPFKSKGLLLAAGECTSLERSRFELTFSDSQIQGILDGGHNLLAIALFILRQAAGDKAIRGIRRWENISTQWKNYRSEIEEAKTQFNFLTPMEIVYPQDGPSGRDDFQDAILDVARARNNNSELTEETKANKAGLYDGLRASIDPFLEKQIEWKSNDGGRIKVRELIALSWIPLSLLGPDVLEKADVNGVSIYRNKGACVSAFNTLMQNDSISIKAKGEIRELVHDGVRSALALMKEIPRLFDMTYQEFPDAYNNASSGFGRISSVRIWEPKKLPSHGSKRDPKYLPAPPKTKFYQQEVQYDFPDGFVMPLVWALRELMENSNGIIRWKVDPEKFIKRYLNETLKVFHGMIQMAGYDPQKVGKTAASYELISNDFRNRVRDCQDIWY
jgi:hypothetical protein